MINVNTNRVSAGAAFYKTRSHGDIRLNVSLIFSDSNSTDYETSEFFTVGEDRSTLYSSTATLSPPESPCIDQRKLSSVSRQSFASTPFTASQPSSPVSTVSEDQVFVRDPSLNVIRSRTSPDQQLLWRARSRWNVLQGHRVSRLNVSLIFSDSNSTDYETSEFFTVGEDRSTLYSSTATLSPPESPCIDQRKLSSVSRQSFASTPFTASQPSSPVSTVSEDQVFVRDPSLNVIRSRTSPDQQHQDSNRIYLADTSSNMIKAGRGPPSGGGGGMKPVRNKSDVSPTKEEKESPFMRRLSQKQKKKRSSTGNGIVMTPDKTKSAPPTPSAKPGSLTPSERTLKRTISNSSRGSSTTGHGTLSRRQSASSDKGNNNTLTRKRVGSGSVRERSGSKASDTSSLLEENLPPVPPTRTASIKASEVRTLDRKFSQSRGSIPKSPETEERRLRSDSTVVYNDFEEMEALMLQQEELNQRLEQERLEKEQLEKRTSPILMKLGQNSVWCLIRS
eukprot:sb/3463997/